MLGVDEKARFSDVEFKLASGDFLLVSSDGALEAPCADGSAFGEQGVEGFFARYAGSAPLADLLAGVRRQSTFQPLGDDVSALMVAPA